jgi:hypothetical protein
LNTRLRGIGELTELSIDTKKRASRLRLDLLGETEPIEIHITEYAVRRRGEAATVTIVGATASRAWLAAALREFVVGHSFSIPANAGAVLKLLTRMNRWLPAGVVLHAAYDPAPVVDVRDGSRSFCWFKT